MNKRQNLLSTPSAAQAEIRGAIDEYDKEKSTASIARTATNFSLESSVEKRERNRSSSQLYFALSKCTTTQNYL